jgi:hypothetical protein
MRTLKLLSTAMIVVGLAVTAFAQGGMRRGPAHYNPATETTLTGTLDEVKSMPSPGRGGGGVHLVLSTDKTPVEVRVGPASFVSSRNFTFEKGDRLTVVGSKVTMNGQQVVIAREIRKGDQVLTLRDAKGFPLWSRRAPTR